VEGDDSNMSTALTSGPEATSSQGKLVQRIRFKPMARMSNSTARLLGTMRIRGCERIEYEFPDFTPKQR
jgi:hypothetical protein